MCSIQLYGDYLARAKGPDKGAAGAPPRARGEAVALLENSAYLERYLWPHFEAAGASAAHVLSVAHMVNEKVKAGVPPWDFVGGEGGSERFGAFFGRVAALVIDTAGCAIPFELYLASLCVARTPP